MAIPDFGVTVKTFGNSVRAARQADKWFPLGSAVLCDAVATLDTDKTRAGVIYDPAMWTGAPTGGVGGEAATISAAYEMLKRINEQRGQRSGNWLGGTPVVGIGGHGAARLAQLLSKDNMLPKYAFSARLRAMSYATQLREHVAALGHPPGSIGIPMWVFDQGQADALVSAPYGAYLSLLAEAREFGTALAAIFDQTVSPLMLMIPTGQHWTAGRPSVPQAQQDFALSNINVRIVGPSHAWPGKMKIPDDGKSLPSDTDLNEHDDGNVARWKGAKIAALAERYFYHRVDFEHLHVVRGRWSGNRAIVSWHSDHQIAIEKCYVGYRLRMLPDLGIHFSQGSVEFTHISATVFGARSIEFIFDHVPLSIISGGTPVKIHIAVKTGRANIANRDPGVSRLPYVHSHQDYAAANPDPSLMTDQEKAINEEVIVELGHLFGQPMPLTDWAVIESFELEEVR